MKELLLALLLLALSNTVFSQVLPPPAADMATKEQEPYIDSLIEVCNYNVEFNTLRDSIVENFTTEYKLDENAINYLKDKIQYDYSRFRSSSYNCFARKSEKELKEMISKYRELDIQRLSPELRYLGRALLGNMESWIKFSCEEYILEEK